MFGFPHVFILLMILMIPDPAELSTAWLPAITTITTTAGILFG
jgi:hypothetical protein